MGIKKVHPNGTMDYIYSSPRIKIINELSKEKTHKKSDLIYKKMQDPLFAPKNKNFDVRPKSCQHLAAIRSSKHDLPC